MTVTDQQDLAWAKASLGVTLTAAHKRLVALGLAQRVYDCGDGCLTGQELRILGDISADLAAFPAVVDAYRDWRAVEDNVDDWRFRYSPPMGVDRAFEHVQQRLDDAISDLVTP